MEIANALQGARSLSETLSQMSGTEAALIRRCQANDAAAFDIIVKTYQDRVYHFVRRMLNDIQDAEDVAQEVFVRAYGSIARFDHRASLSTWLFKIASNLCIDHARRKARKPEPFSLTVDEFDDEKQWEIPDERFNPEQKLIDKELSFIMDKAVQRLSDKLREVLLLHDIENLSYDEIAQVVKCPLGTVKSRLFLARTELQKTLKAYLTGGEAI